MGEGAGTKGRVGVSTDYNEEPPAPPMPLVDANVPGLGRHGKYMQEERRQSGDLDDDPPEMPVQNDSPFRALK